MAVFTLEPDYPSETGYPLDNSHQTDNTSGAHKVNFRKISVRKTI